MGLQEDHDLANDLLLRPALGDALLALGADAVQGQQGVRVVLDDVEDAFAEGPHQLARKVRPDALDHARTQIALDAVERGRLDDAQLPGLELQAVLAVVDPPAAALHVLAGRDAGRGADHRDQVSLPPHLHPQHAKAAVGAVEGHALDGAG